MDLSENIKARFNKAKSRKTMFEQTYKDAQQYLAPHREIFDEDNFTDTPGMKRDGAGIVFDSTGIEAQQAFASNIQSALTPVFADWIKLVPGPALNADSDLITGLEQITDTLFSHLRSSNFAPQIAESYLDLCIGTGALLLFKGNKSQPFRFVNVPLSQLYLEEGPLGRIDTAFRHSKIILRNILATWPNAKLSSEIKDKLEDNPDGDVKIIEATIPAKIKKLDKVTKEIVEADGYKYIVMIEDQDEIIYQEEMTSSPWIIFRYSVLPFELYGRGPGLFALPDIKTLNKTKELILKGASLSIHGIWTVVTDQINTENVQLSPGSLVPVDSNGGTTGKTIERLPNASDPNIGQLILNDLRASINKMMLADPLGPIDLPVKTATEMSLRQQNLSKRQGAAFGRLDFELIKPLTTRMLDILEDLELVDLTGYRVDGGELAIQHISPLALAQKEESFQNKVRVISTVSELYGPQVTNAMFPADKVVRSFQKDLNVGQDIVASDDDLEAIEQAVMAQAAQGNIGMGDV